MGNMRCPICGKVFDPSTTEAMPFCSKRCKLIDLSRWLDERYGLPLPRETDQEEEEASRPEPPEDTP